MSNGLNCASNRHLDTDLDDIPEQWPATPCTRAIVRARGRGGLETRARAVPLFPIFFPPTCVLFAAARAGTVAITSTHCAAVTHTRRPAPPPDSFEALPPKPPRRCRYNTQRCTRGGGGDGVAPHRKLIPATARTRRTARPPAVAFASLPEWPRRAVRNLCSPRGAPVRRPGAEHAKSTRRGNAGFSNILLVPKAPFFPWEKKRNSEFRTEKNYSLLVSASGDQFCFTGGHKKINNFLGGPGTKMYLKNK